VARLPLWITFLNPSELGGLLELLLSMFMRAVSAASLSQSRSHSSESLSYSLCKAAFSAAR
jgi:hypothetical protein